MTKKGAEIDGGVRLASRDLRDIHRFSHEAMATVYEIHTAHADRQYAAQAAQATFDLIDRLEGDLSRFRPNSDIARINSLAAGEGTRVAPTTIECLGIARQMFDVTGGAFDVSIGTGLPSLEIDTEESVVSATTDGVRIDLGGIGKGYAVDLMAQLLEEWGLHAALVHGGFSSMLALDAPPDRDGWTLTLSDPDDASSVLVSLVARQMAFGASGVRKRDHIVDPRSGEPVRGRRAAWLTLRRPHGTAAAAVADALTTACMLLDRDDVDALCRNSPGTEAWILDEAELLHFGVAASERSERACGTERAGEAASE